MVQAPAAKITRVDEELAALLALALGRPVPRGPSPLRVDVGVVWLVANLENAKAVAALTPDMDAMIKLSALTQATGLTVFGRSDEPASALHVRSFAPAQGIPEDPVCGSGNASVAAFLLDSGLLEQLGPRYTARQGMQVGRDGHVTVSVDGERVSIGGYSVSCIDGTLRVA